MADVILDLQKLYIGGRDFSSAVMALRLRAGREALEKTTLNVGTRVHRQGIQVVEFEAEGLVDMGVDLMEEEFRAQQDLTDVPIIVPCTTGLEGTTAYAFRSSVGDYEVGAEVGGNFKFRASARAYAGRPIRGTILHDLATARTASGNGTAFQVGAVSATQRVYACLMATEVSAGDTLDVILQSDTVGFGSPTTRITFAQITAAGQYEWKELAGAVTDDYWRANYTLGGAAISIRFILLIAICNAA